MSPKNRPQAAFQRRQLGLGNIFWSSQFTDLEMMFITQMEVKKHKMSTAI